MIRDFIAIFGVLAGFSYYVLTVRATKRNQELQLETRQAQLFTQLNFHIDDVESISDYMEILNWQWDDYNDFEMKYGSDNNIQAYAKRTRVWNYFNMVGKLLDNGLIDIDLVFSLMNTAVEYQWYKWKDIIEEQRRRYYTPAFLSYWEKLYNEIQNYRREQGLEWTPPPTLSKYIPDK